MTVVLGLPVKWIIKILLDLNSIWGSDFAALLLTKIPCTTPQEFLQADDIISFLPKRFLQCIVSWWIILRSCMPKMPMVLSIKLTVSSSFL